MTFIRQLRTRMNYECQGNRLINETNKGHIVIGQTNKRDPMYDPDGSIVIVNEKTFCDTPKMLGDFVLVKKVGILSLLLLLF